ncbi:hypothetical protein BpHYR1_049428 [Brachionus plicatilis]|uniref:Uncharacterized protein n=1 Tax=Brachionus plicatilis TaxID=10195 RepID=A0A3M7QJT6_BRAPC|nr:hypothetical protein BpHYR1_049428 [Brachionus plicatilis]
MRYNKLKTYEKSKLIYFFQNTKFEVMIRINIKQQNFDKRDALKLMESTFLRERFDKNVVFLNSMKICFFYLNVQVGLGFENDLLAV